MSESNWKKHYDQSYEPFGASNNVTWLVISASFLLCLALWMLAIKLVAALVFSYFVLGGLWDLFMNYLMGNIWSRESLKEVGVVEEVNKDKKENERYLLEDLKLVSWLPRWVGILERIIFTTGFILHRYEFVGGWLALKVIGSWKGGSSEDKEKEIIENKRSKNSRIKLWRVRENIFLIGTALSLILSFFSAQIYLKIVYKGKVSSERNFSLNQGQSKRDFGYKNQRYYKRDWNEEPYFVR